MQKRRVILSLASTHDLQPVVFKIQPLASPASRSARIDLRRLLAWKFRASPIDGPLLPPLLKKPRAGCKKQYRQYEVTSWQRSMLEKKKLNWSKDMEACHLEFLAFLERKFKSVVRGWLRGLDPHHVPVAFFLFFSFLGRRRCAAHIIDLSKFGPIPGDVQ